MCGSVIDVMQIQFKKPHGRRGVSLHTQTKPRRKVIIKYVFMFQKAPSDRGMWRTVDSRNRKRK